MMPRLTGFPTGFTQALLGVITQKYILSPTNTGMFTSEIPSSLSTPQTTGGANTPSPYAQPVPGNPPGQGVNPLLVAATHANQPAMGQMSHMPGMPVIDPNSTLNFRPSSHAQTPTSVKTVKPPEYFSEWKEHGNTNAPGASGNNSNNAGGNQGGGNAAPGGQTGSGHGLEEAVFLGAQVASKVIFILDQGISKGFMSRVDYNENGPSAVHEYIL